MTTLFIGTYTRETAAEGIYGCEWDPVGGRFSDLRLVAAADNPSFLIAHLGSVFAVHETADFGGQRQGALAQYRPSAAGLELVAILGSGGSHPCHLAADDRRLAVANYSGASVGLFALADGRLATQTGIARFEGRGPDRRQATPHPHGVYFREAELLVPDLGLDRIHRLDPATGLVRGAWQIAPASGPRQLCVTAGGRVYLLNELANRIDLLHDGVVAQSVSTLPETRAASIGGSPPTAGASSAGCLALSADGGRLIASNRGRDSLVCFPVDPDTGALGTPDFTPCDPHPRHFLVLDDRVIVASRDAGTLTAFELRPGKSLGQAIARLECPAPVCVLAATDARNRRDCDTGSRRAASASGPARG